MSHIQTSRFLAISAFLILLATDAAAQDKPVAGGGAVPEDAMERGIQGLEHLLDTRSDVAMRKFIRDNLADSFQNQRTSDEVHALLNDLRDKFGGFGGIGVRPSGNASVRISFEGCKAEGIPLDVEFDRTPPHKITALKIGEKDEAAAARSGANAPDFTWNNLADQLRSEEKENGFSGTVLVVRNGKVVLHNGYGLADRERKIPCTKDTVYAVGSTPIDFTRGAILKLEEMGKLSSSDPITKFFDNVPDDKKSITIDHLMSGRSGLPNFHHIPGEDDDYDLTWIDRDTAIKRIFAKELRFQPGQDKAHSHSAFGLLAAIVEIASKQSYQDFLDEHFFGPAEITSTVLYQKTSTLNTDQLAVGYGMSRVGTINTPAHWGATSWLVLGSGGMVSTPEDLYKWVRAIWTEKTLTSGSKKKYWTEGILAGGNDRGFLTMYRRHPDTMFFMCSNASDAETEAARRVGKGLAKLMRSK